jgi:hypothetical protein
MKNSILEMIDQSLYDFENDRNNEKNIKMLLSFKGTSVEYNEQKFNIEEPKFKKKLNTSVYIKGNNNKLF